MEGVIKETESWICFFRVSHTGSLAMNDIGKTPRAENLCESVIDCQNWFERNQKVSAIPNNMCMKTHCQTRELLSAPDKRFVKILLLLKRFQRMMGGLRATVASDAYKTLNFDNSFN